MKHIPTALAIVCVFYLTAVHIAWQFNNPKANPMTVWTCFPDAICFRSLPEFQR